MVRMGGRSPLMTGQMLALMGSVFTGLLMPQLAQANDSSPLCSNRQMTTQVALSTPDYLVAICSTGYLDGESCYVPTDYFYVGQALSTKESVVLPATIDEASTPEMTVYQAIAAPTTYQIATSGSSTAKVWTSFSVFENGERSYHHLADQYFGYRSCFPTPKLDGLFLPQPLELPDIPLQPAPSFSVKPLPTIKEPTWLKQEPLSLAPILMQRWDEEIDRYDQQIRANPEDITAYFGRANRNYELRRYQAAIADYGEVIRLEPNHVIAHFNRGVTKYRTGDFDGAIADYGVAVDHAPDWLPIASFYNNWAIAYSNAFYSDTALSLLDKAIELDPNYAMAYHNRAVLQHKWINYSKAIADYSKAIKLNPFFVNAYLYRGRAFYEDQGTDGHVAIFLDPSLNSGNYGKAIADFTAAIELDPQNSQAYFQRGIVHYRLKKYDQAITDFEQAIALDDDFIDAYNNLGVVYAEGKQDYGRAIFYFYKTTSRNSQYGAGFYNLAIGYIDLGTENTPMALGYLEQAIALDPYQYDRNKIDLAPRQAPYTFQDTRELTPSLAEIILPSASMP